MTSSLGSQLAWLAGTVLPWLLKGSWPAVALAAAGIWGASADRRQADAVSPSPGWARRWRES